MWSGCNAAPQDTASRREDTTQGPHQGLGAPFQPFTHLWAEKIVVWLEITRHWRNVGFCDPADGAQACLVSIWQLGTGKGYMMPLRRFGFFHGRELLLFSQKGLERRRAIAPTLSPHTFGNSTPKAARAC